MCTFTVRWCFVDVCVFWCRCFGDGVKTYFSINDIVDGWFSKQIIFFLFTKLSSKLILSFPMSPYLFQYLSLLLSDAINVPVRVSVRTWIERAFRISSIHISKFLHWMKNTNSVYEFCSSIQNVQSSLKSEELLFEII